MFTSVVTVWVLTALAAVVIVVTRLRLGGRNQSEGPAASRSLVRAHLGVGVVTWLLWVVFLLAPEDTLLGSPELGIVAIGGWWLLAGIGLSLLARWRRPRGRHTGGHDGAPLAGLLLSVLGHVGMLLGVLQFTYVYLVAAV
ncbi:MAG: hypothetical protein ACI379_10415 [Nocardioides sp.]|uniref:hypothetical protein n=1 Tax=Nocardioides sp. TaxID=35761 RepID=UPI003F0C6053